MTTVRPGHCAVRGLDIAIVLHQGERSRRICQRDDGSSALTMVPADIQFVQVHPSDVVLSRDDAFIGVTLQKELAALVITLLIDIDRSDFRRRETYSENTVAVSLPSKRHRDCRYVDTGRGARPHLKHGDVEILALDGERHNREMVRLAAVLRDDEGVELVLRVALLSAIEYVIGCYERPVRDDAESTPREGGFESRGPHFALFYCFRPDEMKAKYRSH